MAIGVYIFLVGEVVQKFAQSIYCVTVSRFIIGFASSSLSVLVPIYLGEFVHTTICGTLGTLAQFCLVIGI